MTTKVKPTVEKWVESIKQTCFDCIDYDGETVTWQSVLDKYLTEIVSEIKAHSVQEAKAEREKIVIANDGDYVKVPMTVIKHIWDMRMPQTSRWRESGEIHYNKAIEDILRLIKPNILSTLNTKAALKQEGVHGGQG